MLLQFSARTGGDSFVELDVSDICRHLRVQMLRHVYPCVSSLKEINGNPCKTHVQVNTHRLPRHSYLMSTVQPLQVVPVFERST